MEITFIMIPVVVGGDFDGARCRRYFGRCIRADELYPVLWHERAGAMLLQVNWFLRSSYALCRAF